ncbi:TetR/AcrR family transcriptional regulator C-terminal domain-containing protein [Fodinicola acaciae]|uniref:TetR/AcrR family transcriptional regulator C-terminal domain-containing protein n=1 Tax=Fodinicola acaciae TaxID=2681555 RepID=UPI0013D26688|nr:TetR/AcrR family transcriptional regulator C-terminal domain-containing protein [Fodinicola acaciae]
MATDDPPYVVIGKEIRRQIESGELRPGDRVPSTRRIAADWGVAMATATKVLSWLRQQELVETRPGAGTAVRTPPPLAKSLASPTLTVDAVVRAGIALADAEGLSALSMRRIAADLGVGTMSLYHYVPSKEELERRMANTVLGAEPLPDPRPAGWRAHLDAVARLHWRTYRRHPWAASVILGSISRPPLLPSGISQVEWELHGMAGLALSDLEKLRAITSVHVYVGGLALSRGIELENQLNSGVSTEQKWGRLQPLVDEIFAGGRFPLVATLQVTDEEASDIDALFEFGLRQHLDGLAAYLAGR